MQPRQASAKDSTRADGVRRRVPCPSRCSFGFFFASHGGAPCRVDICHGDLVRGILAASDSVEVFGGSFLVSFVLCDPHVLCRCIAAADVERRCFTASV